MPVDGGYEQAFASHNPKHAHRGPDIEGSDCTRDIQDTEQTVPSANIPHYNAAVDGA